jgi:hypothetical protein
MAAIGAAILLAFDATFILTGVFDWGPVTLLLAGGVGFVWLLNEFDKSRTSLALAAGFLLAGVMLWYKVIFAFQLAGVLVACIVVFPQRLRRHAQFGNVGIALIALLIGAGPLVQFNLRTGGATLKASAQSERVPLQEKLMMLRLTLDGKALEHYMVRSAPGELLKLQGAPLGELARTWYSNSSLGTGSLLPLGLILCALELPFLASCPLFKPIAFAWVAALSTEALFLLGGTSGAGPHHTVLLYPAPQFIVAATAAALMNRARARLRYALSIAALALMGASDLVLLCNYHSAAVRNGFSVFWTDGTRQLANVLRSEGNAVAFLDWGIEAPARIECGDMLRVVEPTPARENALYVTHDREYEMAHSTYAALIKDAAARGLAISEMRHVPDSHGKFIFSVFSFSAVVGPTRRHPPAQCAHHAGRRYGHHPGAQFVRARGGRTHLDLERSDGGEPLDRRSAGAHRPRRGTRYHHCRRRLGRRRGFPRRPERSRHPARGDGAVCARSAVSRTGSRATTELSAGRVRRVESTAASR